MKKLYLEYGVVESIDDPDKLGLIQIRILPQMKDIKKDLLPWAKPFINKGFSASTQSLNLPNEGDKIYVYVDKDYRIFYYVTGAYIEGLFNYADIKSSLGAVTELSDKEYPNINFELKTDGTIFFHNRISGDTGLLHSTGTYFIIDTNGYIFLSEVSGNKISIDDSGILVEDKNSNTVTMNSSGMKLEDKNGHDITMGSTSVTINGNLEIL